MNISAILFIICAIAALACFVFSIYRSVELKNDPKETPNMSLYFKRVIPLIIGFAVGFTAMLVFAYSWMEVTPKVYEALQAIIGGAIFSSSLAIFINAFIVHYYRKNLPQNLNNFLFKMMMAGFGATVVFMFVTLNGFADYMIYPLVNGISFSQGFVKPGQSANVAFYALCILSGALFVYFLCDHKFYMEYGKHGVLESTFLVAFPAGIIGARIFYVIGNFNLPAAQGGFDGVFDYHVFAIWEGGLTILGGAIMGIVVGVAWFMWRNKGLNIWLTVDIIVPTILLAQAIGRWGNFFNCEVHGMPVDENMWLWLPRVIWHNAHWTTSNGLSELTDGTLYVPLFFIEGLVNCLGFGILAHLFGIKLRKFTELGDLAFGYVIWYGLTRVVLEPLRDPAYNMGKDGYWSWVWSMVFMLVGALLIALNHIVRFYIRKKQNKQLFNQNSFKNSLGASIGLGITSVALMILGFILMITGEFTGKIAFNAFNFGLVFLIIGGSVLLFFLVAMFNLGQIRRLKGAENA